jgi:predicted MFS family arabinose efflux permease
VGAALIDRLGRKPLLVAGSCLTLLASLGFLTVESLGPVVYLLQALVGASFVFAFNATIAMATDGAPSQSLGRVIGYIAAANMVTNALGTVTAEHLAGAYGWRAVFAFAASASLAALVIASRITDRPSTPATAEGGAPLGALLAGPVGRVVAAAMLMGGAFIALFTFVQPLALERGATTVSPFFVAFTASAVLVRVAFGGLGDRHGRARVSRLALALYAAVTAAGQLFEPSIMWLIGGVFGLAHGVAYPTMNALAIELAPEAARGRAITLFNGAFNLGASMSAFGFGQVAERWGYRSVFLPASALGLVALLTLSGGVTSRAKEPGSVLP